MARRAASRPQPGRWRRLGRTLLLGAAAFTASGLVLRGGAWALDPATLPVETVKVTGQLAHVDREALKSAIEPFAAAGFLRVDMAGLREAVEALPEVHRAAVRRTWPATLVVAVEEQRAAAVWAAGGLVNQSAERFGPAPGYQTEGLPVLDGPDGSVKDVAMRYVEISGMLRALGVRVTYLSMSARHAWQLRLDNGLHLKLGRRNTDRRLLRFVRTYAEALAPRLQQIESVDLRYTNGFAVQWKNNGAPTA